MIKARSEQDLPEISALKEYLKINKDWMIEWIKAKPKVKIGRVVRANTKGYFVVGFNRKTYLVHRIIWALHHGIHPPSDKEIDHIDGNPSNNNIGNLRLCDRTGNTRNRQGNKDSTSKYKGVHWDSERSKWVASGCNKDGIYKYIGRFEKEDDAALAYDIFAKKHHGDFAKLNFQQDGKLKRYWGTPPCMD